MIYTQKIEFANTIYSKYPLKNAGGDQKLILRDIKNINSIDVTRILLAPPSSIPKYGNYDLISLCLYPFQANLQTSQEFFVDAFSIKTYDDIMWIPGVSLDSMNNLIKTEGSSWIYKTSQIKWEYSGGDYILNPILEYNYSYRNIYETFQKPMESDIWIKYGILIKYAQEGKNIGQIKYYSPNTQTIFYPRYKYYIKDYKWVTSSHSVLDLDKYIVTIPNIQFNYQQNNIERFYIRLFPKIYSKDWTNSYWSASSIQYSINPIIPATYCIYDTTNIQKFKVFDHDEIYTRLSCDGQRNYFDLDMSQLLKNRFYQIQLKINNKVYPIEGNFKIV